MPCMPCIDYMLDLSLASVSHCSSIRRLQEELVCSGPFPFPTGEGPGTDYKTVLDPLHQTAGGCGDLHEQNSCSCLALSFGSDSQPMGQLSWCRATISMEN